MAQDLEQIIGLLREMHNVNNASAESFDRLLKGISAKLDSSASGQISKELLKTYLDDLARTMSGKYDTTITRFADIEQALKAIYNVQKDQVKSSDVNELFSSFSSKMAEYFTEIRQQKVFLTSLESKLSNIANDETAKDDILRSVTLIRADFENLNNAYKNVIDEMNLNVRSLISSFVNTDQTKINNYIKDAVDSVAVSINEIIGTLSLISEKETNLESILNSVSTKEGLKETNELVSLLIERADNISDKIDELPDKYDTNSLKESSDLIIDRLGETAKDVDLSKIAKIIEDLYTETDEIKKNLGIIAEDIQATADIDLIENSFGKLYLKLNELFTNIENSGVKSEVFDVLSKIDYIKDELSTIKSIIGDLEESVSSKIMTAVQEYSKENGADKVCEKIRVVLSDVLSKECVEKLRSDFIDKYSSKIEGLTQSVQNLSTKQDIDSLKDSIDNIDYSQEFESLYKKTEAIEDMLSKSSIEDPAKEILENLQSKADQATVTEVLNKVNALADAFEDAQSVPKEAFSSFVSELFEKINSLKDDISSNSHIWHEDIQKDVDNVISAKSNVADTNDVENVNLEIKPILAKIISEVQDLSDVTEENKNLADKIFQKLDLLVPSDISEKFDSIESHLISISDFMKDELKVNDEEIKATIREIREIIANNKTEFSEILRGETHNSVVISDYISEIKKLFAASGVDLNQEIKAKLEGIENSLIEYNCSSKSNFDGVLEKLNEYEKLFAGFSQREDVLAYTKELASLQSRISDLSCSFANVSNSKSSEFISEKLVDLRENLSTLISDVQEGIQQGFVYNSELIEEKTQALLDLIRQERHSSTQDIESYEKLTVADVKLADIKQELEFVNTDISSAMNSLNESVSDQFSQITESLSDIVSESKQISSIRTDVEDLAYTVKSYISENALSSEVLSKETENLYERMSSSINEVNNDLKDFILGDIDSVLIKLDDTKEELEAILKGIVPPNPQEMKEFHQFVKEIADFKSVQKEFLDEIKQSVTANHEDLKSIVQLALNDSEIIQEVKNLAASFKDKAKLSVSSEDGLGTNIYDSTFADHEEVKNALNVLFDDFESKIATLSGQNNEVMTVLSGIKSKLSNAEITESDEGMTIKTSSGFDFEKAFQFIIESVDGIGTKVKDIIQGAKYTQKDIERELSENTDAFDSDGWLEKAKYYLGKDDVLQILKEISLKIDSHYAFEPSVGKDNTESSQELSPIKEDFTDELHGLNDSISFQVEDLKHDVLENLANLKNDLESSIIGKSATSKDLAEIKKLLMKIDDSVGEASSPEETEKTLSDITNSISEVTSLLNGKFEEVSKISEKVTSMLEVLDRKLDIVANDTTSIDELEEIRELILSQQESFEQLKMTPMLEVLNQKLDIVANDTTNSEELEEIRELILSQKEHLEQLKVTSMLEVLNHKLDVVANDTSNVDELDEIRELILSQQEYLEQLKPDNKTDIMKNCLDDLLVKFSDMSDKSSDGIKSSLKEMKESIMSAVVNIFSQVSFIEESEDIKDFVEEKTDTINRNLELVTEKLKQIASADEQDSDYTYSMQDIESDLAKLRMALNQLQETGITSSSSSVADQHVAEHLSKINDMIDFLSQEELQSLKTDITDLRLQTSKILQVSDESYSDLKDEISLKVDKMTNMLEQSSVSDKVMRQALIYIGEWIDSTSESINKISQNSEEISDMRNLLEMVNTSIPQGALASIEENFELQQQRLSYFEKQIAKIGSFETRFEQQEKRIDRLEMNIDKILSAIENIDDAGISRKIEKIEKQMNKLSVNIDKLTSYVD